MKLPENITELKVTFTDPTSGKQLRIHCLKPVIVHQSLSLSMGNSNYADMELFCDNLQYSDKNP